MWKCSVCNYVHNGEEAPHKCPKCGADQEKFNQLTGESLEKVEISRFSNSLLKELILQMEQLQELAEAGIEDDLDPGCVKLYKEALESAKFLKQTALAEIEIHVSRGKWG
ncbi:rubredoxin [Alkalicella caledoniensis]|uniref:Rubredoxin n=1 Tax=Alkalicella caledoniensis TaxID=2731377 RepID=A0A7G9W734_ALKCA|nr:rubredoxin [Alkalicella caledoniensis]QNO14496.1 rubredoxin [Alkalicella caledoniensis]